MDIFFINQIKLLTIRKKLKLLHYKKQLLSEFQKMK